MATAWSNFPVYDETGKRVKLIKPGEDVSAGDLNIEDEEFAILENIGAVRDQEYPTPEGYEGSPIDYAKEQLAKLAYEAEEGETFFPLDGSMVNTPQMDARAQEAMDKIGYDPEKSPEEQSLSDTVDEDAEQKATVTKNKSATAEQPPVNPATGTNG